MSKFLITALFGLVALLTSANALYDGKSSVISLTTSNFDRLVYGTEHPWMIEFYAPWCGHCKQLAPEYEKAAENLKGIFRVGAVDCNEQSNQPICSKFDVKGFPTVKIFPSTTNEKKGQFIKVPRDYQGARSARPIADACLAEIPNYVTKISEKASGKAKTIDDFLASNEDVPKAILFTTKSSTTALYKALSVDFKNRMVLGEVRDTEKAITEKYSVTSFPTLIVISGEEKHVYEGGYQHEALTNFFEKYALPGKKSSGNTKEEKKTEKETETFNPEITRIETQQQFKEECLDRSVGMCLVSFMIVEPEFEESVKQHQEEIKILQEVKKAAHDKKFAYRFLWIDALKERDLMNFFSLSDQTPSLLMISPSKKVYRPFTGAYETPSILEFLDETSKAKGRYFKYTTEPTLSVTGSDQKSE